MKEAMECSDVIWQRGLLRKGYGICHGTSGNGYSFLSLYHLTQDKKYLYRACKVRIPLIHTPSELPGTDSKSATPLPALNRLPVFGLTCFFWHSLVLGPSVSLCEVKVANIKGALKSTSYRILLPGQNTALCINIYLVGCFLRKILS